MLKRFIQAFFKHISSRASAYWREKIGAIASITQKHDYQWSFCYQSKKKRKSEDTKTNSMPRYLINPWDAATATNTISIVSMVKFSVYTWAELARDNGRPWHPPEISKTTNFVCIMRAIYPPPPTPPPTNLACLDIPYTQKDKKKKKKIFTGNSHHNLSNKTLISRETTVWHVSQI